MKNNSIKAIAKVAAECAYSLERAIETNQEQADRVPWIVMNGMTDSLKHFARVLHDRRVTKSLNDSDRDALCSVAVKQLDISMATMTDHEDYDLRVAKSWASFSWLIFFEIAQGRHVNTDYVDRVYRRMAAYHQQKEAA